MRMAEKRVCGGFMTKGAGFGMKGITAMACRQGTGTGSQPEVKKEK